MTSFHDNEGIPNGIESILIVDDDSSVLHFCQGLLEALGYKTTLESCPSAALELFSRWPHLFDLVITDLEMKPFNGAVLSSAVTRIRPDVPVIAYTGSPAYAKNHSLFVEVLEKPTSLKRMAFAVRRALDVASVSMEGYVPASRRSIRSKNFAR